MSGNNIVEIYNGAPADFPITPPKTSDYTARQLITVYGTDKPNLALLISEAWKELRTYFTTDPVVRELALFLYWSSQSGVGSSPSGQLDLFDNDEDAAWDAPSGNTSGAAVCLGERGPTEEQRVWGHRLLERARERFRIMQIHRAVLIHFVDVEGPWAGDPEMQADIFELTWKMLKAAILRFREMVLLEEAMGILDGRCINEDEDEYYDASEMAASVDGREYCTFEDFVRPQRRTRTV
ncbi:uncharacterized protein LAJ45_03624 [Morchella importuna]|uniref:uncharacterized protein n=1 Tax=Morchella importuna TaxID=1174673 RepID=UPI001E8EE8FB|nr:uncharacterized protein LAJ45_03624 [Morchella importuna]KAH8152198.1 hypothetical protein LAJ45_03624 [Morchella importuna]